MKNVLLALTILLVMSNANAGLWTSLSGAMQDTIEPKAQYSVAASGDNIRVYEWETPTGKHCILAATSKSSVMQCFDITQ